MGAGAIGLLCALTARFEGCEHTAIVDIAAERVQFALDNRFADVGYVVESGRARDADDNLRIAKVISTCVEELIRPDGQMMGKTDYTFECTGMSTCLQASIYVGLPQLSGFVGSHHGRQNWLLLSSDQIGRQSDSDRNGDPNSHPTYRGGQFQRDWHHSHMAIRKLLPAEHRDHGGFKRNPSLPQVSKMITHRFTGLQQVPDALKMACRPHDDKGDMVIKVALLA
jgi:L-iditol 2-dehydrogenase